MFTDEIGNNVRHNTMCYKSRSAMEGEGRQEPVWAHVLGEISGEEGEERIHRI